MLTTDMSPLQPISPRNTSGKSTTPLGLYFFFFNDTATTEIYTLSLHDALPILRDGVCDLADRAAWRLAQHGHQMIVELAARSEEQRLNSSHSQISYAVFCLKKKKNEYKYYSSVLHYQICYN